MNQTPFRLIGLEPSPYSQKVASFLNYKNIDYQWLSRSLNNEKLFKQHAKVALIPLLLFPSGEAMQDSTLIIERLEQEHPTPSIHPEDPALWFLSCLFEEFGDEWCNKLMFFQRWIYQADAKASSKRLAAELLAGKWWASLARPLAEKLIVRRMVPRLSYSGANATTIPQLKDSFETLAALLNSHFEQRPYLLGARPCFGDFGLWCNLHQAWTDPTAGAYLQQHAPALVAYIQRMLTPSIEGGFETLETLRPSLKPVLAQEIATRFLPWMDANQRAAAANQPQTSLTMHGKPFAQKTFAYQAKTFAELKRKFANVADNETLVELLRETNCLDFLLEDN